ncbi:MAG: SDR family oxidoreductase [Burkholderiaceae bacterium]
MHCPTHGPTGRVDRELGPRAMAAVMDVTDQHAPAAASGTLPASWQQIDVLVNNAGHDIGGRKRFDLGTVDEWVNTIQTNVLGAIRVTHALLPGMVDRGRGHIVNIGSIFGLEAHAGSAAYCTSKFAINGFSKAILDDFRGKGVRVTQILPGVTRTEFSETRWQGDQAAVDAFYRQFDQVLEPEDVARMVRFAVEQPAHVTISDLVVIPAA